MNKRSVGKVKWVDDTLVRAYARIGICTSEAAFIHAWRSTGSKGKPKAPWICPGADGTYHKWTCGDGGEMHIVCVPPRGKSSRAWYAALIVHEATHVWQQIREGLGEREPSAEFEAYSMQSICQRLFDAVGL